MDSVQVRAMLCCFAHVALLTTFMQGQALLAAISFGLELNSDDRIRIFYMRNETVNATLPPRVSQKKSTSSRGKIRQNLLPI
jgi:hypothetical protein